MQENERAFKTADASVYLISSEASDKLEKMRREAHLSNSFVFLSDRAGQAAAKYAGRERDTPWLNPATFVIGWDGTIVYAYVDENVSVRASISAVLAAVRMAQQPGGR